MACVAHYPLPIITAATVSKPIDKFTATSLRIVASTAPAVLAKGAKPIPLSRLKTELGLDD